MPTIDHAATTERQQYVHVSILYFFDHAACIVATILLSKRISSKYYTDILGHFLLTTHRELLEWS